MAAHPKYKPSIATATSGRIPSPASLISHPSTLTAEARRAHSVTAFHHMSADPHAAPHDWCKVLGDESWQQDPERMEHVWTCDIMNMNYILIWKYCNLLFAYDILYMYLCLLFFTLTITYWYVCKYNMCIYCKRIRLFYSIYRLYTIIFIYTYSVIICMLHKSYR